MWISLPPDSTQACSSMHVVHLLQAWQHLESDLSACCKACAWRPSFTHTQFQAMYARGPAA